MRYFDWLVDMIAEDEYDQRCYQKVLSLLFYKPFKWIIDNDENRANDGLLLRESYRSITGEEPEKRGPCSVLEMMIGLACRCEDDIMHDSDQGDRTSVWFWEMMDNLGLSAQDDYQFDEDSANQIVDRFLNRNYRPNGDGGPFYIPNFGQDMRKIELWYQLNCYIQDRFYGW